MYTVIQPPQNQPEKTKNKLYNVSVIVTSDTCFKDETKDVSGLQVVRQLKESPNLFANVTKRCVSDDRALIVASIKELLRNEDPALIITIGGTGLCPRDVTPEATSSLYEKPCSGIVAALHMASLRYTPHAALSRLTAGIIGQTLVVNFPGSARACQDCLACLMGFIHHALEQVRFNAESYNATHLKIQQKNTPKLVTPIALKSAASQDDVNDKKAPKNNYRRFPPAANKPHSTQVFNKTTNSQHAQQFSQDKANDKKAAKNKFRRFAPAVIKPQSNQVNEKTTNPQHAQQISQDKANDKEATKEEFCKFVQSIFKPQPTQVNDKTTNSNLTKSDSRSSRLSIREVLESSVDQLGLSDAPQVNQPPNSIDLIEDIACKSTSDTPSKLELTKVPRNESNYPMIEIAKAHEIMSTLSYNLLDEKDVVTLTTFGKAYNCIGSILAEDIAPKCLIPPYSVSTMDGYVLNIPQAVKKAIGSTNTLPAVMVCDSMKTFESLQEERISSFFCYQVNTGGKLPANNFAVVPFENTTPCPNRNYVYINDVKPGLHVRTAGSDLGPQDVIRAGTIIGPVELSMIAAMQHKVITILKRPTIGLLSTGDELVSFFTANDIDKDDVVDTNGPLLASLFRVEGYRVLSFGIVKDDPNAILAAVSDNLKKCEVLLITGGASMGTRDYVKDVIEHMGGTIHFGRVSIKPGKPASFASILLDGKRRFIFSLPGNPLSAYVTSLVLVLPFLEHAIRSHFKAEVPMTLDCVGERIEVKIDKLTDAEEAYTFDGRLEFIRAKISKPQEAGGDDSDKCSPYLATVSLRQQSSCMVSLMGCNCLIMIDPSLKGNKLVVGEVYPALKLHRRP